MTSLGAPAVADEVVDLAGGLGLRTATDADRQQIVDLSVAAHGDVEHWGINALLDDPSVGPERFTVVVHRGHVVSTLGLMTRTWRYRGGGVEVTIPVGQPEYVATQPGHRDKGLVRRQLDVVQRWSADRGDLVQTIVGIPYFYRRFGYEYAAAHAPSRAVPASVQVPDGFTTRAADAGDVGRWIALEAATQARFDLAADRTRLSLERAVDATPGNPYRVVVAETGGEVQGVGMTADWGDGPVEAGFVAATATDAAAAVLAGLRDLHPDRPVRVIDRVPTASGAVLAHAPIAGPGWAHYVRVGDPVALLDHLRPVLSARLAQSALSSWSGELLISTYRSGIRVEVEAGTVGPVTAAPAVQDPQDDDGVGVPPDLVATLVFGRLGAVELEQRHDDVFLGRHRAAMAVLFPPMTADLPTEV